MNLLFKSFVNFHFKYKFRLYFFSIFGFDACCYETCHTFILGFFFPIAQFSLKLKDL